MGQSVVVLGAQWGDEGKGKIVDLLTEEIGAVVRFQAPGAANRNSPSSTATRHSAAHRSDMAQRSLRMYCRNGSLRSSTITLSPPAKDLR